MNLLQKIINIPNITRNKLSANDNLPINAIDKRSTLYENMIIKDVVMSNKGTVIIPDVKGAINRKVDLMLANKNRYEQISHVFPNPIRWFHIALIHELECTQNFNCYLGNGQPFYEKTTIVPKGRGPFKSFKDGAIDAIKLKGLDKIYDWSIGNTLYILEGFNGYGYANRGINSPYLWSGSNQYTSGKYIADGIYSSTAVSNQIGVALLYKELENRKEIF